MLESDPPQYRALQQAVAQAYADAVVLFLETGCPAEVARDGEGFVAAIVEPGTSPTDVDLWVADGWDEWVPGVAASELNRLGAAKLRAKIVDELVSTNTAVELLNYFFNRDGD